MLQDYKTARTLIRCLSWLIAALIGSATLLAGTYINDRFPTGYTVSMSPSGPSMAVPVPQDPEGYIL